MPFVNWDVAKPWPACWVNSRIALTACGWRWHPYAKTTIGRVLVATGWKSGAQIQGTRRGSLPTWFFVVWAVFLLFSALLQGELVGPWIAIPVVIVIAGVVVLVARAWGPRTDVLPTVLHVRQGRRRTVVAWDKIQAVETPGRWEPLRDLHVRLQGGASLPLPGMPAERWAEKLESYWRAHRS